MSKTAHLAQILLASIEGAIPTLMVLVVLILSGLPPFARILHDVRGLLALLLP